MQNRIRPNRLSVYHYSFSLYNQSFICLLRLNTLCIIQKMWTILIIILGYWTLASLFALYNVKKIFQFYKNLPPIQIKEGWKGLQSRDFGKYDEKAILLGCFIRFPLNFLYLGFFLVSFVTLIPLSKFFGKTGKKIVSQFQRLYGNFAFRRAYNIMEQQDYRKFKVQTPIVISNHINWFDIWYIGTTLLPLTFLAKSVLKNVPIIGAICDFFDTIYVQRNNQGQKDSVIHKISERVHKFQQNKKIKNPIETVNPIIIFPEGTTSNGESILTFKMGAFNDLAPITMFGIKYICKQFSMGMGDVSQSHHAILSLCLRPTLVVVHKVVHPNQNQTAEQYCKRCRQEMSKLTGFPQVQTGYRDTVQFQNAIKQAHRRSLKAQQNKRTKNN